MSTKKPTNTGAYLEGKQVKPLVVKSAPYTSPGEHEILVKNYAVAINPIDWFKQFIGNVLFGHIKYPFILGEDLACEVVEVGKCVTRFHVGDRVLAHALGFNEDRNRSTSVLPLALSTAAVGLFQKDQLALKYPTVPPKPNGEALLIWSGSSSVGSNAIQLATTAGYEVFTTASPKNFEYVKRLGAVQAFDYRSPTVIKDIVNALKNKTLVGAMAIDNGSADACISVLEKTKGGKFVALASVPVPEKFPDTPSALAIVSIMASVVRWQLGLFIKTRTKGITTKFILGDSLQNNEVSKVVYEDFLPRALAEGKYVAAPEPIVVGHGLEYIQEGLMFRRKACRRRRWL